MFWFFNMYGWWYKGEDWYWVRLVGVLTILLFYDKIIKYIDRKHFNGLHFGLLLLNIWNHESE